MLESTYGPTTNQAAKQNKRQVHAWLSRLAFSLNGPRRLLPSTFPTSLLTYHTQSCGIKKHPSRRTHGPCVEIASRLVCSQDFGKPPTSLLIGRSLSAFYNGATFMSTFCLLDKLPASKNRFLSKISSTFLTHVGLEARKITFLNWFSSLTFCLFFYIFVTYFPSIARYFNCISILREISLHLLRGIKFQGKGIKVFHFPTNTKVWKKKKKRGLKTGHVCDGQIRTGEEICV